MDRLGVYVGVKPMTSVNQLTMVPVFGESVKAWEYIVKAAQKQQLTKIDMSNAPMFATVVRIRFEDDSISEFDYMIYHVPLEQLETEVARFQYGLKE